MRHVSLLKRSTALLLPILIGLVSGPSPAEEFQSRSASAPAPQTITASADVRGLAPPNPQAERDRREAELSDHHRPGPLLAPAPAAALAAPRAAVAETALADAGITLVQNRALTDAETNDVTSTVGEPSVGTRGSEVLFTGNWYAAFSGNGGTTFNFVNPSTTFPSTPHGDFCCDQAVVYVKSHDLMVWFLQYLNDSRGNVARVAVAQGADIAAQQWRFYDFTPQSVGNWANEWFDFPEVAASGQFLYVTSNVFTTNTEQFARAVILRLSLAELSAYQPLNYQFFDTTQNGSLRPTQGAGDTMYFASHVGLALLRVFTWPEASNTVTTDDVGVQAWGNATRVAPGPDGRDWLGRADHRVTAAWRSGDEIGFAWTASQDGNFPFPHVRVAIMDRNTKAVTRQPHLWSSSHAYAYPAAAPNSEGVVGLSVAFGGGAELFPSHAVGILDDAGSWRLLATAKGTHGPSRNVWGDYFRVGQHGGEPDSWVATGFTLQGGSGNRNIEPRYVHFRSGGDGVAVTLENLSPGDRLGNGDTTTVRATVTVGGVPAAGKTVQFASADTDLATVEPATATTDAAGQAEATVTGRTSRSSTTQVSATVDGTVASVPVEVPDLSAAGLLVLVAMLAALALRRRTA